MKKFQVQFARVETHIFMLEIEAENEDIAGDIARDQFNGDGKSEIVYADEFVHQIDEMSEIIN